MISIFFYAPCLLKAWTIMTLHNILSFVAFNNIWLFINPLIYTKAKLQPAIGEYAKYCWLVGSNKMVTANMYCIHLWHYDWDTHIEGKDVKFYSDLNYFVYYGQQVGSSK